MLTFKNFSGAIISQDCQGVFFLFIIKNEKLEKEYRLESVNHVEASCEALDILDSQKMEQIIIDYDDEYSQYLEFIRRDEIAKLDNLDEIDPIELMYEDDSEEDEEDDDEEEKTILDIDI